MDGGVDGLMRGFIITQLFTDGGCTENHAGYGIYIPITLFSVKSVGPSALILTSVWGSVILSPAFQ